MRSTAKPRSPLSSYQRKVLQQLGCTHEEALIIEDLMRTEILHSTLDWLSDAEFRKAAGQAGLLFCRHRKMYVEFFQSKQALFNQMRKEAETIKVANAYEI